MTKAYRDIFGAKIITVNIETREDWTRVFGGFPADAPAFLDEPPSKVLSWETDSGDIYPPKAEGSGS